ncbi:MAG: hypothetical protein M1816_001780 [Peltula sp. TS41687]|nr:MAG: hypothetical protein M1816_001780 [Peltula sp. TS41687]
MALLRAGSEDKPALFGYRNPLVMSRSSTEIAHESFNFLPTVNFDDIHRSIRTYDLELSQDLPQIGVEGTLKVGETAGSGANSFRANANEISADCSGNQLGRTASFRRRQTNALRHENPQVAGPAMGQGVSTVRNNGISVSNRTTDAGIRVVKEERAFVDTSGIRPARTGSFRRRQDAMFSQTDQPSMSSRAADTQNAPPANRMRRGSQFQSNLINSTSKLNRKSLGPGVLGTSSPGSTGQLPRQGQGLSVMTPSPSEESMTGPVNTRRVNNALAAPDSDHTRLLSTSRNAKIRPPLPPSRDVQDPRPKDRATPVRSRPPSTATNRALAKSPGWPSHHLPSSSSSNKRVSVALPHATGLGARTISPTDARRMKRLSMLPDPPPVPQTPPTPHPDTPEFRSATQSPSMIPRKSITPSSSRTTPEHSRKSYTSNISVSSSSNSYTSAQTSTGSHQPRMNQVVSSSRLPTPKPRNLHSSADDQDVPPVPAIPKAYESPKENFDGPFFADQRSGVPPSIDKDMHIDHTFDVSDWKEPSDVDQETRRRPRLAISASPSAVQRTQKPSELPKQHLQPLRLPPLNLLPLSKPTVAKVAALQEAAPVPEEGRCTPHPKRATRTPTTPMTASKASFMTKTKHNDEDMTKSIHARRSSSNLLGTSESTSVRARSGLGLGHLNKDSMLPERQTATSYNSFSLPKPSGDFRARKGSDDLEKRQVGTEARPMRVYGPRAQTYSGATPKDDAQAKPTTSSGELTTPSSSSLRRKWSLSFRRSSSKASFIPTESHSAHPLPPPKHGGMPPPKLPASAIFSETHGLSPSAKSVPNLELRSRKNSGGNQSKNQDLPQSRIWSGNNTIRSTKEAAPLRSGVSAAPQSGMRTTKQNVPNSKPSSTNMTRDDAQGPGLDRDDLAAEEEMRKLASKRKDLEAAASELDLLNKIALPKERVSPAQALRVVNLNIFERGEIVDYRDVYFCGTHSAKKHVGELNGQSSNFGYDDERGDYNIVTGDHLAYRYEIIDILGKGSFGQVVRCVDHRSGGLVAVKIIRNKKRFHQQALVEVNILRKLREWDPEDKHSMVNFTQSFYFRGHLCISTELLGMNLYEFIKLHDFRGFSLKLIRRFTKQLLSSLVLLHSQRIIHCDLKPENILLVHPMRADIKVIDFGSSCFESAKVYTYIQSRFYRSPEVILGMSYGMPIDIWSLGCILAELYTGYPIFPGENEQEQLACIMEVFGPPEKHLIEKSTRKKLFFDSLGKPRLTVSSKGRRRRPSSKTLQQALKCEDEAFLDFIGRCLRWDPDRRLRPEEALQHDFITGVASKKPGSSRTRHNLQPLLADSTTTTSPLKRVNTIHTSSVHHHHPVSSSSTRPLPDPPSTSTSTKSLSSTNLRSRDTVYPTHYLPPPSTFNLNSSGGGGGGGGGPSPSKHPAISASTSAASILASSSSRRHSTINGLQSNASAANVGIRRPSNNNHNVTTTATATAAAAAASTMAMAQQQRR